VLEFALRGRMVMIRTFKLQTLSAFALAMMLPIAAYAVQGTTAKSTTASRGTASHALAASSKTSHHPARMASHTHRAPAVDINSASKEDLMKLPGITDELAQKIIDARPFKSKTELTKKQILTKAEYTKVRSHVIAKQEKKTAEAKSMESTPEAKAPESK
jgi:competence protein ComEA